MTTSTPRATFSLALPSDTLTGVCPRLGPLRNNGGVTPTHALASRSPAIDTGNDNAINPITLAPYAHDQRGAPYPRISGVAADIGAYEVDQGEFVFNSGFEGCP